MRTSWDALRSLARYVHVAMGDEWEVRFLEEEGVFERPLALVWSSAPAGQAIARHHAEMTEPFSIHLYPAVRAEPVEALELAMASERMLADAFVFGVGKGHPARVPLYDYDGKGLLEGADEDDRFRADYMRVLDGPSFRRERDPDDPAFYTVVCTLRLGWRRSTDVPSAPTVLTVPLNETAN